MTDKNWPLYEVFLRPRNGLSHKHVGSLHAIDDEMALQNARDVLHAPRRGAEHLGGAVQGHHRVRARREGHAARAIHARAQALPTSNLLRHPRRGRAHVMLEPAMATAVINPHYRYVLRLADNALVLGHRLTEWSSRAPTLEEDIALSNIALDLIGQARSLYRHAVVLGGEGRDEDQLAYLRDAHEFLNVQLVERPNGDFAATMARQLCYCAFAVPLWEGLARSRGPRARRHRRQGREGMRLPPAPQLGVGDPPGRRHAREP